MTDSTNGQRPQQKCLWGTHRNGHTLVNTTPPRGTGRPQGCERGHACSDGCHHRPAKADLARARGERALGPEGGRRAVWPLCRTWGPRNPVDRPQDRQSQPQAVLGETTSAPTDPGPPASTATHSPQPDAAHLGVHQWTLHGEDTLREHEATLVSLQEERGSGHGDGRALGKGAGRQQSTATWSGV